MPFQFRQTGEEIQDILDLAELQLATPYNDTESYAVGDYCVRGSGFYRCTEATTGTWDASKWSAVTVGDVLETANANIASLNATLSNLYYKSGDTINGTNIPAFGIVTGGAATLDVFFRLPKLIPPNATFNVTNFACGGLRISTGGYIPNQPGTADVSFCQEQWGCCILRASNSGTGVTNNTPVAGTIMVTMTMN